MATTDDRWLSLAQRRAYGMIALDAADCPGDCDAFVTGPQVVSIDGVTCELVHMDGHGQRRFTFGVGPGVLPHLGLDMGMVDAILAQLPDLLRHLHAQGDS
jgi:hypothetical protein